MIGNPGLPRVTTQVPPPIRVGGLRHVPTRYRVRIGRYWYRVYANLDGSEYVLMQGKAWSV